jgi:hypothetical protein
MACTTRFPCALEDFVQNRSAVHSSTERRFDMPSPAEEHALLLAAATPVDAELARNLLAAEGIPCLFHGMDRDVAELGVAVHMTVSRPDVYVPKSALKRAVQILRETWKDLALPESPPG